MNKKIKLYNWSLPTFLFFVSSIWYWLALVIGSFIINSIVLLISGLVLYKVSHFKLFYKGTIIKAYLFGLLSNVICVITLLIFEITHIYPPFLYGVNPAVIALIISFLFSVMFNYLFTFESVGMRKYSKVIISIILGIVNLPFVYLIPSETVSVINSNGITKFIDLFHLVCNSFL